MTRQSNAAIVQGMKPAVSNEPSGPSDRELIVRFLGSDPRSREAAFNTMVARHTKMVYGVAYGILRNHADADEMVNDTFVRAHRSLHRFRGECELSSWFYRIATNLSRNRSAFYRRREAIRAISLEAPLHSGTTETWGDLVATMVGDGLGEVACDELWDEVNRALGHLSDHHRSILTLRFLKHQSYIEIGQALGIAVGTVKSKLHRARECLIQRIMKACPEAAQSRAGVMALLNGGAAG